jgi:hypothetical protein
MRCFISTKSSRSYKMILYTSLILNVSSKMFPCKHLLVLYEIDVIPIITVNQQGSIKHASKQLLMLLLQLVVDGKELFCI